MRFRCVCKSWDSSITTPNFISTHLYNNKNKHPHHHNNANGYVKHMPSLPSSSNISVCTVAFDRTFDRIYETEIPSDFVHVHVVGSCNGLLYLAEFSSSNVIYLWNPSVRKFKKFPDTCLRQLMCATLGFAYHSENNDYRLSGFHLLICMDMRLRCTL